MSTNNVRSFSCKDEDLTAVSGLVAYTLTRDLPEFTGYTPKVNEVYVADLKTLINETRDLLEPASETLAKKILTERYTQAIKSLTNPVNRLEGYINLAKPALNITPASFGIAALRRSVQNNDPEGVAANLHIVLANVQTYKVALFAVGLTTEFVDTMTATGESITSDRQAQMEIVSKRRSLVQSNIYKLNDLNERISEILAIGKILYKGVDPAKLADYAFTQLLKRVRQTAKSEEPVPPAKEPVPAQTTVDK